MLLIPDQRALAGKLYTDIPRIKKAGFINLSRKLFRIYRGQTKCGWERCARSIHPRVLCEHIFLQRQKQET